MPEGRIRCDERNLARNQAAVTAPRTAVDVAVERIAAWGSVQRFHVAVGVEDVCS